MADSTKEVESAILEHEVISARDAAGEWLVEAIDHEQEGEVYMTRFSGPRARERAEEYAHWKNEQQLSLSRSPRRQSP